MIFENLKWTGSVELLVAEVHLDLHNCYDFASFKHDIQKRELILIWRRGTGDWVDASLPSQFTLNFFDVYHLKIEPRDHQLPFTEDDCLEEFGFYSDAETNEDPFFREFDIDPNWLWSFTFQSKAEIVVGAKLAKATLAS